MKEGDVIRSLNGKPFTEVKSLWDLFTQVVREKADGGDVHMELLRKGQAMTFDMHYPNPDAGVAQLRKSSAAGAARHPVGSVIALPNADQAAPPAAFHLGARVRAVTGADVTALGLPKLKGVVVTAVEKGSLAEEMQMQAGDVIVEVNGSEIGDVDFFTQFVHSGAVRSFRVWRNGKLIELSVPQST
jgi:S1-C subfamily serine protease